MNSCLLVTTSPDYCLSVFFALVCVHILLYQIIFLCCISLVCPHLIYLALISWLQYLSEGISTFFLNEPELQLAVYCTLQQFMATVEFLETCTKTITALLANV